MLDYITVEYDVYSSLYSIKKILSAISGTVAYDSEVRSKYTNTDILEAKELLKNPEDLSKSDVKLCKIVADSSGLSHPVITKMTHFILGLSNSKSIVIIVNDFKTEMFLYNWLVEYEGKLIIHNTGFDLKAIHFHTGKFPKDYEDTQLLAKSLINHCDVWKSRTDLKHLMGTYYSPSWTLIDGYDNEDFTNEKFLKYSAIDGAATYKLWEELQEHLQS